MYFICIKILIIMGIYCRIILFVVSRLLKRRTCMIQLYIPNSIGLLIHIERIKISLTNVFTCHIEVISSQNGDSSVWESNRIFYFDLYLYLPSSVLFVYIQTVHFEQRSPHIAVIDSVDNESFDQIVYMNPLKIIDKQWL